MKQTKWNNQDGVTLLMVLSFMILATIVSTVVYNASIQSDRQSFVERDIQRADVSVKAGEASAKSYIRNKATDFVGVLNQFYNLNILDTAKKKIEPILLPLQDLESTGASRHEKYEVYLAGLNINPTGSADLQVKLQIHGSRVANGKEVSKSIQNVIYDVNGVVFDSLAYLDFQKRLDCGPTMALWIGGGVGAGQFTQNLTVTNGGVYLGGNYSANGSFTWDLGGELIVGGVPSGSSAGTFNATVNVASGKDVFFSLPYEVNGGGNFNFQGNVELAAGFKGTSGGGITTGMTVGGDLKIYGGTPSNFNLNGGVTFTVHGTLESDYAPTGSWGSLIDVRKNLIINGPATSSIAYRVLGKAYFKGDYNARGAQIADTLFIKGNMGSGWAASINEAIYITSKSGGTIGSAPQGLHVGSWNIIPGISPAQEATSIKSQMDANNEIPLGFGVDAALVDKHKRSWNALRDTAYAMGARFPEYEALCPKASYGSNTESVVCKFFSGPSAQLMWSNSEFQKKVSHNDFIYVDFDVEPTSTGAYFTTPVGSDTKPVLGNWVFTKTTGTITMASATATQFPDTDPTSRSLIWFRDQTRTIGFEVGASGAGFTNTFHGIYFNQGANMRDNGANGTKIVGAMYLDVDDIIMSGAGAGYVITLDLDVVSDVNLAGIQKLDANGVVIDKCYPDNNLDVVPYFKGLKLLTKTLKVSPRSFYGAQGEDIIIQNKAGNEFEDPEKQESPYLALSKNLITIPANKYSSIKEARDSLEIDVVTSYRGKVYLGSDISKLCGSSGAWKETERYDASKEKYYTVTFEISCKGKSLAQKLIVKVGDSNSGTSAGTGTSSGTTNSSATNGSSSATIPNPTISITSPNLSSDIWTQNRTETITWNSNDISGQALITIIKNGVTKTYFTVPDVTVGTYSYIPQSSVLAVGTDYRVIIAVGSVADTSDHDFELKAATLPTYYKLKVVDKNGAGCIVDYQKIGASASTTSPDVLFGSFERGDVVALWVDNCGEAKWNTATQGLKMTKKYYHEVTGDNDIDVYMNAPYLNCRDLISQSYYYETFDATTTYKEGEWVQSNSQVWEAVTATNDLPTGSSNWRSVLDCSVSLSSAVSSSVASSSASSTCTGIGWIAGGTNNAGYQGGTTVWYQGAYYKTNAWIDDAAANAPGLNAAWIFQGNCSGTPASSIAVASSASGVGIDCSSIPAWQNKSYDWVSSRESVVYQGKAYSHQDWVAAVTPDTNPLWNLEGTCK